MGGSKNELVTFHIQSRNLVIRPNGIIMFNFDIHIIEAKNCDAEVLRLVI